MILPSIEAGSVFSSCWIEQAYIYIYKINAIALTCAFTSLGVYYNKEAGAGLEEGSCRESSKVLLVLVPTANIQRKGLACLTCHQFFGGGLICLQSCGRDATQTAVDVLKRGQFLCQRLARLKGFAASGWARSEGRIAIKHHTIFAESIFRRVHVNY